MKWRIAITLVLLLVFALTPQFQSISGETASQSNIALASIPSEPVVQQRSEIVPPPTAVPTAAASYMLIPLTVINPFPITARTDNTETAQTPLRARAHFPKPNAQAVSPDSLISIMFNAPMDHASVETRIHIIRADNGASVDGYFEWEKQSIVFYPVPLLESDTVYRVILESGARASDTPATLDSTLEWQFSTGHF